MGISNLGISELHEVIRREASGTGRVKCVVKGGFSEWCLRVIWDWRDGMPFVRLGPRTNKKKCYIDGYHVSYTKKGNRVVRFTIDIRPLASTIVDVAESNGVTNLRPIHGH